MSHISGPASAAATSPSRLNPLQGVGASGGAGNVRTLAMSGTAAGSVAQTRASAARLLSSTVSIPAALAVSGRGGLGSASAAALGSAASGAGGGSSGSGLGAAAGGGAALGRIRVSHGYYAGAVISEAAQALLSHGELEARRIYDRRAREAAGGAGVVQAVGTNAAAETGAAIQLGDVEGSLVEGGARGGRRGGASGGGGLEDAQSFLESLRLPLASLEALAAGDFLYLMPIRARGRHGVMSPSGTVVGHENCYDLRVVDHRHTDPDSYFTLSDSGIVHVSEARSWACSGLAVGF
jgi:hypothetical protein